MTKIIYVDNGQLELCPRFLKIWGLSCQRPNNKNLLPIYRILIIDRYSYLYSYSSTSTRTRTRTHVIIKYSYSYSYSHILQVLVLVLVLVNLVLAPALVLWKFMLLLFEKWCHNQITIIRIRIIRYFKYKFIHPYECKTGVCSVVGWKSYSVFKTGLYMHTVQC